MTSRQAAEPHPFPWKLYAAELAGTALLVLVGLSFVILDFGRDSPVAAIVPSADWRRVLTGFLFGCTGASIAISPLGKESGAHINPVVTLGFWMMGRFEARHVAGYVISQLVGAAVGAAPLLAWGAMGRSVEYGATVPGMGDGWALVGEAATTFAMVFLIFYFLRRPMLRRFTPAIFPPLFAVMVWAEATVSGTSTNPARTLGPGLVAGEWHGWWVYWLGPAIGTLAAVGLHRLMAERWPWIEVAKLCHFAHDRYGVFHRAASAGGNNLTTPPR